MEPVQFREVKEKIITIRGQQVLLDSDVAEFYGVETRDVNKSVKNNPDKFPEGYIFELDNKEFANLRWKNFSAKLSKTRVNPKVFTEKGLYMLATILKNQRATQSIIAIVETFAKIRDLSHTVAELSENTDDFRQKLLMQKGDKIVTDILGYDLKTTDTETGIELNFAVLKFKHTINGNE
ncbi:MAG: ORF6N domain-containing protein [Prevotellaceae bacterium]|nr:ORF6N domain-containing protein [Prevotellaceae bacterium]